MKDETLIQACLRTISQQAFHQAYWRSFDVVAATTDALRQECFRLRDSVFGLADRMDIPGIGRDRFDDRAQHFLLVHRSSGDSAGTARLLFHEGQGLPLQESCDHPLFEEIGQIGRVCELSRLCMAARYRQRPMDGRALPAYYEQERAGDAAPSMLARALPSIRRRIPYAPLGLLMAAFDAAAARRASECVTLLHASDFRTLKRLGIDYKALGPRLATQGMMQPIIFNIRHALDTMAHVNAECWEVVSDKGRIAQAFAAIQQEEWHDSVFGPSMTERIVQKLL